MNYLKFFNTKKSTISKFQEGGIVDPASKIITWNGFGNGEQGTVKSDTTNMKLDRSTGTIFGANQTTTYAEGDKTRKELAPIQSDALKATAVNSKNTISGGDMSAGLSGAGYAAIGQAVTQTFDAIDGATMGDKNFSASSKAIDTVVHGASSALIKSGNPYAMAAGVALEGLNFATKAGGKNVQGFDVDIASSGYGNLGHKESEAGRVWDTWSGATARKLAKRNEEARMALAAADVAQEQKFEQESRMNSVDNVIRANSIALAGGIDTSLLAAKHGARLERIEKQRKTLQSTTEEIVVHEDIVVDVPEEIIIENNEPIIKAQNGAKLEQIEVSTQANVIPSGAMHKNKNHLDLEVTEKGIPVITVEDDSAETFEDIKEQEDTLIQHAEVEEAEIIFNKELTVFLENLRKQWHESNDKDKICLEAGMRLAKEIVTNTDDNTDVTENSLKAIENEND